VFSTCLQKPIWWFVTLMCGVHEDTLKHIFEACLHLVKAGMLILLLPCAVHKPMVQGLQICLLLLHALLQSPLYVSMVLQGVLQQHI